MIKNNFANNLRTIRAFKNITLGELASKSNGEY